MVQSSSVNAVLLAQFGKKLLQLGIDVEGRVRFVHPEVDEERLSLGVAFFDERDGALDIVVDEHLGTRAIERPVVVVTVLAEERRVWDHVVGQMPFAVMSGGIARFLQEA